jgi:hypothetical protein
VALTTGAPLPAWVREGLVGGASAEARFRQLGELSLAAMTAETPAEWAALIRTRDRLRRRGPEAPGTRAEQDSHLRAMERFLMGAGRRKGRGPEPAVEATRSNAQRSALGDAGERGARDGADGPGADERSGPVCAARAEGPPIDLPPSASEGKQVGPDDPKRAWQASATGPLPAPPSPDLRAVS